MFSQVSRIALQLACPHRTSDIEMAGMTTVPVGDQDARPKLPLSTNHISIADKMGYVCDVRWVFFFFSELYILICLRMFEELFLPQKIDFVFLHSFRTLKEVCCSILYCSIDFDV